MAKKEARSGSASGYPWRIKDCEGLYRAKKMKVKLQDGGFIALCTYLMTELAVFFLIFLQHLGVKKQS